VPALVSIIHHVVAVKGTMTTLATDLARRLRSLIIIGWVTGVALAGVSDEARLIGARVAVVASRKVASTIFGNKVLAAWIYSWREPCLLEVSGVLMVEV
jgi:hypothetical protein